MTNEEAINVLFQVKDILINSNSWLESTKEPITDAFNMAIEALKGTAKLATDTISRQAAIDVILADKIDDAPLEIMTALGDGRLALTLNDACNRHIRDIEKLPSIEPGRKKEEVI